METTEISALWADDGVDLMPGEAPMVGKDGARIASRAKWGVEN